MKLLRIRAVLALSAAVITSNSLARSQATTSPTHSHHPMASVIDGTIHPELIPDVTAYRLWLVAVSTRASPTDEQTKRPNGQLANIGLQGSDQNRLIAILADFNTQYHTLIQKYNAEATTKMARGEKPDVASMRLQRDQLVQSTQDRIKASLTTEGWSHLDAHVHNEKRRMKIHLEGGEQ